MKTLVYAIAALTCLTAAPVMITPADAQTIQVGPGGVRVGPDYDYRGSARAQDRRHYRQSDREGCRDVTVRTQHRDGSVSVRTTRRCD